MVRMGGSRRGAPPFPGDWRDSRYPNGASSHEWSRKLTGRTITVHVGKDGKPISNERKSLDGLPPFIRKAVEYLPWMKSDSPYVAFRVRTGSTYVGKGRESGIETSNAVRRHIRAYKAASSCVVCGESDPCCLHFHHRDPETKSFEISRASKYSLSVVKEEIEKCDVLCANCHAKVHAKRITRLDHWIEQQESSIT